MHEGATEEKIARVADATTSDLFSEPERAALAYAEAMTITGRKVDDELFARVRKSFSEAAVARASADWASDDTVSAVLLRSVEFISSLRAAPRLQFARKPKWRILTKPVGRI